MTDSAERAAAALAAGTAIDPALVGELLTELAAQRTLAEQRWQAVAALAPAAKRHRGQAQDLARLALDAAARLGPGDAALATQLADLARAALPAE